MQVTVKTNARAVSAAINKAGKKIVKAARYGTHNWMKQTMNFSRAIAPEDTGATKATAYAYFDVKMGAGHMGFATWYAPIIHFTNRHYGAPHFLLQAVYTRGFDGSLGKMVRTQLHQKRVSKKKFSIADRPDTQTAETLRAGSTA